MTTETRENAQIDASLLIQRLRQQRNEAHDESAKAWAYVDQMRAELDRMRAETERLRSRDGEGSPGSEASRGGRPR